MVQAPSRNGPHLATAQPLPLLATKLFIPPTRPGTVARPHLCQLLDDGLSRRLTLISAPAGYGKTTLLAAWRSSPPARELPFAWLSLDDGDNDPIRFWTYFIAALQTIQPHVGEEMLHLLQTPAQFPPEAVLPSLINDLTTISRDFCLVLDDYHLLHSEAIHQGIAFLLEHLPPPMHLVISSRTDPPLPLSLLRGRGQLTELREEALRFSVEEMAAFLHETMRLSLPAEQVAALHALTEGWIAGVQMAAVSLRGHQDTAGFIAQFGGSHRHVADYLLEQVLARQGEEVQGFLRDTCILKRLCGGLCEALTGQVGGQGMLERLEVANLFLIPLDDERRWYRYQHLFADLLRHRLQQGEPGRVRELHRRAAGWLEQNGLAEEAIPHALGAEDFEQAADLIERVIDMVWSQRREVDTVLNWLKALPEELVLTSTLRLWYFWALEQGGSTLSYMERLTQGAEDALNQVRTTVDLDRVLELVYARIHILN